MGRDSLTTYWLVIAPSKLKTTILQSMQVYRADIWAEQRQHRKTVRGYIVFIWAVIYMIGVEHVTPGLLKMD